MKNFGRLKIIRENLKSDGEKNNKFENIKDFQRFSYISREMLRKDIFRCVQNFLIAREV